MSARGFLPASEVMSPEGVAKADGEGVLFVRVQAYLAEARETKNGALLVAVEGWLERARAAEGVFPLLGSADLDALLAEVAADIGGEEAITVGLRTTARVLGLDAGSGEGEHQIRDGEANERPLPAVVNAQEEGAALGEHPATPATQFHARCWLARARCLAAREPSAEGQEEALALTMESLRCIDSCLKVIREAPDMAPFMVRNALIVYIACARPLMRAGSWGSLGPSASMLLGVCREEQSLQGEDLLLQLATIVASAAVDEGRDADAQIAVAVCNEILAAGNSSDESPSRSESPAAATSSQPRDRARREAMMEYFQSYLWRLLQRAGGGVPSKGGKGAPDGYAPTPMDILSEMRNRPRPEGEEGQAALQTELISLWAGFDDAGAAYAGELLAGKDDADPSATLRIPESTDLKALGMLAYMAARGGLFHLARLASKRAQRSKAFNSRLYGQLALVQADLGELQATSSYGRYGADLLTKSAAMVKQTQALVPSFKRFDPPEARGFAAADLATVLWNVSLPFFTHDVSVSLRRIALEGLRDTADLLEVLDAKVCDRLRAQIHYELALCYLDWQKPGEALHEVKRSLAIKYEVSEEVAAVHGTPRPSERLSAPLYRRLILESDNGHPDSLALTSMQRAVAKVGDFAAIQVDLHPAAALDFAQEAMDMLAEAREEENMRIRSTQTEPFSAESEVDPDAFEDAETGFEVTAFDVEEGLAYGALAKACMRHGAMQAARSCIAMAMGNLACVKVRDDMVEGAQPFPRATELLAMQAELALIECSSRVHALAHLKLRSGKAAPEKFTPPADLMLADTEDVTTTTDWGGNDEHHLNICTALAFAVRMGVKSGCVHLGVNASVFTWRETSHMREENNYAPLFELYKVMLGEALTGPHTDPRNDVKLRCEFAQALGLAAHHIRLQQAADSASSEDSSTGGEEVDGSSDMKEQLVKLQAVRSNVEELARAAKVAGITVIVSNDDCAPLRAAASLMELVASESGSSASYPGLLTGLARITDLRGGVFNEGTPVQDDLFASQALSGPALGSLLASAPTELESRVEAAVGPDGENEERDVEVWARLARAAFAAGRQELVLACCKAAQSQAAIIEAKPEIAYWVSVLKVLEGRVSIARTDSDDTAQILVAVDHFVHAIRMGGTAQGVGGLPLVQSAMKQLLNAAIVLLRKNEVRQDLVGPLGVVVDNIISLFRSRPSSSKGPSSQKIVPHGFAWDFSILSRVMCLSLDALSYCGQLEKGIRVADECLRVLPSMHKVEVTKFKVQFLAATGQGMSSVLSLLGTQDAEGKATVMFTIASESPSEFVQLSALQQAVHLLAEQPLLQVRALVAYGEWLFTHSYGAAEVEAPLFEAIALLQCIEAGKTEGSTIGMWGEVEAMRAFIVLARCTPKTDLCVGRVLKAQAYALRIISHCSSGDEVPNGDAVEWAKLAPSTAVGLAAGLADAMSADPSPFHRPAKLHANIGLLLSTLDEFELHAHAVPVLILQASVARTGNLVNTPDVALLADMRLATRLATLKGEAPPTPLSPEEVSAFFGDEKQQNEVSETQESEGGPTEKEQLETMQDNTEPEDSLRISRTGPVSSKYVRLVSPEECWSERVSIAAEHGLVHELETLCGKLAGKAEEARDLLTSASARLMQARVQGRSQGNMHGAAANVSEAIGYALRIEGGLPLAFWTEAASCFAEFHSSSLERPAAFRFLDDAITTLQRVVEKGVASVSIVGALSTLLCIKGSLHYMEFKEQVDSEGALSDIGRKEYGGACGNFLLACDLLSTIGGGPPALAAVIVTAVHALIQDPAGQSVDLLEDELDLLEEAIVCLEGAMRRLSQISGSSLVPRLLAEVLTLIADVKLKLANHDPARVELRQAQNPQIVTLLRKLDLDREAASAGALPGSYRFECIAVEEAVSADDERVLTQSREQDSVLTAASAVRQAGAHVSKERSRALYVQGKSLVSLGRSALELEGIDGGDSSTPLDRLSEGRLLLTQAKAILVAALHASLEVRDEGCTVDCCRSILALPNGFLSEEERVRYTLWLQSCKARRFILSTFCLFGEAPRKKAINSPPLSSNVVPEDALSLLMASCDTEAGSELWRVCDVSVGLDECLAEAHVTVSGCAALVSFHTEYRGELCWLTVSCVYEPAEGPRVFRCHTEEIPLESLNSILRKVQNLRESEAECGNRGDESVPAPGDTNGKESDVQSPSGGIDHGFSVDFQAMCNSTAELLEPFVAVMGEVQGAATVTLLVDSDLADLPLESLRAWDSVGAVSRDFSVHTLYARCTSQGSAATAGPNQAFIVEGTELKSVEVHSAAEDFKEAAACDSAGSVSSAWTESPGEDEDGLNMEVAARVGTALAGSDGLIFYGAGRFLDLWPGTAVLDATRPMQAKTAIILDGMLPPQGRSKPVAGQESRSAFRPSPAAAAALFAACGLRVTAIMAHPLATSPSARKRMLSELVGSLGQGASLAAAVRSLAPAVEVTPEPAGDDLTEGDTLGRARIYPEHRMQVYGNPFVTFK